MVGMTIARMIPVELNRISRSAAAMGPFGLRTPSEQPPSVATPSRVTASTRYRMSGSHSVDDDRGPRGERRGRFATGIEEKRREQHGQVDDREPEQAVSRPPIERPAPPQSPRQPDE